MFRSLIIYRLLRDNLFLVLCAWNLCVQAYFLFSIYSLKHVLFSQCEKVNVYSLGVFASCGTMLFTIVSAICTYSVHSKTCDPLTVLSVTLSFAWLTYGSLAMIFFRWIDCRTEDYPMFTTIIILAVNVTLGLLIMFFGRMHGYRKMKNDQLIETASDYNRLTVHDVYKMRPPRMNKHLSLERPKSDGNDRV
jgi:hypothetical protein